MKTPNRIRISPANGARIARIADAYKQAGVPRSWNSVGDSAVGNGLALEELRVKNITKAVGTTGKTK